MGFRSSPFRLRGDVQITGSQNVSGKIVVNDDGNASTIDALFIRSEITTPSAPADGDGGVLYVKSDGKVYWRSYEVGETDLTSGGGGGGGGGTPGGSNTQIQFNDGGSFGGSSSLVWNGSKVSVVGQVSASLGISASAFYGDGSNLSGITTSPHGSDTYVQFNDGGSFGSSQNFTWNDTALGLTGSLLVTGSSVFLGQTHSLTSSGSFTITSQNDTLTLTSKEKASLKSSNNSLDLSGSFVSVTGAIYLGASETPSLRIYGDTTSQYLQLSNVDGTILSNGSTAATVTLGNSAFISTNGNIHFSVRDEDYAKVGVGTVAPGATLDVYDSGSSVAMRVYSSASSPTSILQVMAEGNVGIGVDSPSTRLHVSQLENAYDKGFAIYNAAGNKSLNFWVDDTKRVIGAGSNNSIEFADDGALTFVGTSTFTTLELTGADSQQIFKAKSDSHDNIVLVSGSGKVGVKTSTLSKTFNVSGSVEHILPDSESEALVFKDDSSNEFLKIDTSNSNRVVFLNPGQTSDVIVKLGRSGDIIHSNRFYVPRGNQYIDLNSTAKRVDLYAADESRVNVGSNHGALTLSGSKIEYSSGSTQIITAGNGGYNGGSSDGISLYAQNSESKIYLKGALQAAGAAPYILVSGSEIQLTSWGTNKKIRNRLYDSTSVFTIEDGTTGNNNFMVVSASNETIQFSASQVDIQAPIKINSYNEVSFVSSSVSTTSQTVLDTYNKDSVKMAKYTVHGLDMTNSNIEVAEIIVYHSASDVHVLRTTTDYTSGSFMSFSGSINSSNVRLHVTCENNSNDIGFIRNLILK